MGEARGRHQIGDADAIEAALAKQLGGGLDDVGSVGLRLCLGDFHGGVRGGIARLA